MSQEKRYKDSKNKTSIEDGLGFQDLVMDTLAEHGIIVQNYTSKEYQFNIGENRQGIEIKLDNRCTETGRLSIEIAEKTAIDNPWVKSGIYRADSWLYVHGNKTKIWVFFTDFLRQLHKSKRYAEHEEETIKGFFMPIKDANKYGKCFDTIHRLSGDDPPF